MSHPETGENAYIPNVWPESTMPTAARSWPCSVMWSGVIVMISVITSWLTTSATSAATMAGRRRMVESAASVPAAAEAATSSGVASASSYGSGRRNTNERIPASPTNTTGTRYGPARLGSPTDTAIAPASGTSHGPITEPTVPPHTTVPIADARRPGGTMSAAA